GQSGSGLVVWRSLARRQGPAYAVPTGPGIVSWTSSRLGHSPRDAMMRVDLGSLMQGGWHAREFRMALLGSCDYSFDVWCNPCGCDRCCRRVADDSDATSANAEAGDGRSQDHGTFPAGLHARKLWS